MPEFPESDDRGLRQRVLEGFARSASAGSAFINPAGGYAAGARALQAAVQRDSLLGRMLALIPSSEPLRQTAALNEARRRAALYHARMAESADSVGDAFAAGLESVIADLQKGLL